MSWSTKTASAQLALGEMREGYVSTIWRDAAVEELKLPGATITEQESLGRPCKVYSISKDPQDVKKWWVWNGVTPRSESHLEIQTTVIDTSEEAERMEEDVDIDPDRFRPPTDVTFEPAKPAMAQQLNHQKTAPWVRTGPEIEMFWF